MHVVDSAPPLLLYVPAFINEAEEDFLLKCIDSVPSHSWTILNNRRLQSLGGTPHPKGMIREKIPKPHHDGPLYLPVVATVNIASHSVLDFYSPLSETARQVNILTFGLTPITFILFTQSRSFQDPGETSWAKRYIGSAFLERRSANILSESLYTYYMHGIESRAIDIFHHMSNSFIKKFNKELKGEENRPAFNRNLCNQLACPYGDAEFPRGRRISITIRHVTKTCKIKANSI
ncbi:unnamed protein product, partial [Protopolystoma xenopodis]